jgi:hypothetical protein
MVPDDLVVVVRATPASVEATVEDIAVDALESGRTYAVQDEAGEREPLFGVSVFARRPEVPVAEALARFDEAPSYLEARVGVLRSAGFVVLPTGANADHFDVQLLPGHADEDAGEPVVAVRDAAARLVAAAGELRRNPAYAGERHRLPEGQ